MGKIFQTFYRNHGGSDRVDYSVPEDASGNERKRRLPDTSTISDEKVSGISITDVNPTGDPETRVDVAYVLFKEQESIKNVVVFDNEKTHQAMCDLDPNPSFCDMVYVEKQGFHVQVARARRDPSTIIYDPDFISSATEKLKAAKAEVYEVVNSIPDEPKSCPSKVKSVSAEGPEGSLNFFSFRFKGGKFNDEIIFMMRNTVFEALGTFYQSLFTYCNKD